MSYPADLIDSAAPAPGRVGQGTAIEQSRAIAEVQAAVVVAQQCRRSFTVARAMMQESCRQLRLAQRAFYRFPRGDKTVTGSTVYLARELARCWQNVQYGVTELRRDDLARQSEMLAWAWDVETNVRATSTFIVPHKRDTKKGPQDIIDIRDIYENNANAGARRLRQVIFSIVPPHFVEEAEDLCARTLKAGDGRDLAERVDSAVAVFDRLGVSLARLETKLGRTRDRWDTYDLAQLTTAHRGIERGDIDADLEFPDLAAARITAADVLEATVAPTSTTSTAPAPKAAEPAPTSKATK